jgi:hypothetical protein
MFFPRRVYQQETKDWLDKVDSNSGSVFWSSAEAVNHFIYRSEKVAGLWNNLSRVNVMVGDQLAAMLTPIKVRFGSGGTAYDTNNGFVEGDFDESVGLSGDATNKYLDTGKPANSEPVDTNHIALYNTTAWIAANRVPIGAFSLVPKHSVLLHATYNGGVCYYDSGLYTTGRLGPTASQSGALGFLLGTRSGSSSSIFRAGTLIAGPAAVSGTVGPSYNVFVPQLNNSGFCYTPFFDQTVAGYSLGVSLNTSQVQNYSEIWQELQTRLGRAV